MTHPFLIVGILTDFLVFQDQDQVCWVPTKRTKAIHDYDEVLWCWWGIIYMLMRLWRNSPHKQLFHPPSHCHWHSPVPKVPSVIQCKLSPTVRFFEPDSWAPRQIYKFREPCLKYRMESRQSLELMAPCSRRDQSWSIGQSPWNGKPVTEEFWKYLLPKES